MDSVQRNFSIYDRTLHLAQFARGALGVQETYAETDVINKKKLLHHLAKFKSSPGNFHQLLRLRLNNSEEKENLSRK